MMRTNRKNLYSAKLSVGQQGLSLIELCIVLIIMGLILGPALQAYKIYQNQKRFDDTKVAIFSANSALANFYAANGRYPCPADRSIAFGESGHGVEQCNGLQGLGNNSCGGKSDRGYCRAINPAGTVYIGSLPYVTMGIPYSETFDGWKNTFTYAASAVLTSKSTFDPDQGAVSLSDEHGSVVAGLHGAIISSGDNGAGAFNADGYARPCIMEYRESENCDDDGVFMRSLIYAAEGPTYFDDMVVTSDWSQSSIWAYATDRDIYNTNPGNVGIGTQNPTVKLDVAGNVKSDSVHSPQICDAAGANCMLPEVIGGTGRHCPAGQVVTGISNNNVNCASISVNVSGSCPAGKYLVKIVNGQWVCESPPTQ